MNYLPLILAAAFFFLNKPTAEKASPDLGKIAPLLANPDALAALDCVNRLFDRKTNANEKMPIIFELLANPFVSKLLDVLGSSFAQGFSGLSSLGSPASSAENGFSPPTPPFSENFATENSFSSDGKTPPENSAFSEKSRSENSPFEQSPFENSPSESTSFEKTQSENSSFPGKSSLENPDSPSDSDRVYEEIRNSVLDALVK